MPPLSIGVVREQTPGERRVALMPEQVATLTKAGARVLVETGAGQRAWQTDQAYADAGARIVPATGPDSVATAGLLVTVGRPDERVLAALTSGQAVLGMLAPLGDPTIARDLAARGVTAISLDLLPRTLSRAQPMDALTSQANVAGYKAVLVAADAFDRYFPMLFTAAGTVRPAKVLVLGAGVAGLQAIGTAKRLGAVVSAYDLRPEACAEAASVGATVIQLTATAEAGGAGGGYARALTDEEQRAQRAELAGHIARHDIVITTAQVPGRRPPMLVDEETVARMAAGSVLVDLAASALGGNVAGSRPGETVVTGNGVTVVGAGDLAARVPVAASAAYSRNVTSLLTHMLRDGDLVIDLDDEVQAGVVVTHGGEVVHAAVARGVADLPPAKPANTTEPAKTTEPANTTEPAKPAARATPARRTGQAGRAPATKSTRGTTAPRKQSGRINRGRPGPDGQTGPDGQEGPKSSDG